MQAELERIWWGRGERQQCLVAPLGRVQSIKPDASKCLGLLLLGSRALPIAENPPQPYRLGLGWAFCTGPSWPQQEKPLLLLLSPSPKISQQTESPEHRGVSLLDHPWWSQNGPGGLSQPRSKDRTSERHLGIH